MPNIIRTYQLEGQRVASEDPIDAAKDVIEECIKEPISIEDTPIFICSKVDKNEIATILGKYKELDSPDDKKPVILLLKDQELLPEYKDKFTSFKTDKEFEKGKRYEPEEVDKILGVVEKARNIGIAHDQIFEKGFLVSESKTSFKFSEDDPKKYFEAFMEFAAYGGNGNEQRHGEAINKYWDKLLKKFEITENIDSREYCASEIKTKFGIYDKEYEKIFKNSKSFKYKEFKEHSKEKLEEKKITQEESIYGSKHGFVGKIIDGRLYIKSSGDFNGGLFEEDNGVATIFGDFNGESPEITAGNIGDIAAEDPRLATAVTAAVRQLQNFRNISDLQKDNQVFCDGSLFLKEEDVVRIPKDGINADLGRGSDGNSPSSKTSSPEAEKMLTENIPSL